VCCFGTAPGLQTPAAKTYEGNVAKVYPGLNGGNYADGFVYNYYNAAWALVQGLEKSKGALGTKLQASLPRSIKPGYQVSSGGVLKLDSNRQAIQDQWPLQIQKGSNGKLTTAVVGYVPNVSQSFGGLFTKNSPPPGRSQPACKKTKTPWQGKIKVVKNGKVTSQVIK
jgi:branched-chain amino acid transport system substrate-binding protein